MSKTLNIVLSGDCATQLQQLYEQTYHPFLAQTCGGCHTNGPGIGQFGSQDLVTSYNSFISISRAKIHRMALDPGHKPPATGSQNSPIIDPFTPYWDQEELKCPVPSAAQNFNIMTVAKADATIAAATNVNNKWVTKQWDLSSEITNAGLIGYFDVVFTLDIRTYLQSGVAVGYQFRNPSFRLKNTNSPINEVIGIAISINGRQLVDLSTYQYLDTIVNSTTAINAAPGYSFPLTAMTPAATDTFSAGFSQIIVNGVPYK